MNTFWWKWLLTMISFPIGGGIAFGLTGAVTSPARGLLAGMIAGTVIGTAQWIALRQAIPITPVWIVASAVGLSAGLALGVALLDAKNDAAALTLRAVIAGAVLGASQAVVLSQHGAMGWWWAPAVLIGWAVGWTTTRMVGVDLSKGWAVFGISGAAAFTVLSGVVMILLLKSRLR